MSDTRDQALMLNAICKTYNAGRPNEVRVLRDVSVTLDRGEVVALVAPSGAGKSTLLHIAGLLDTPDTGDVLVNGVNMTRLGDSARTAARRGKSASSINFTTCCRNLPRLKTSCCRNWPMACHARRRMIVR